LYAFPIIPICTTCAAHLMFMCRQINCNENLCQFYISFNTTP
jgi:hypothetical protein